MQNIYFSEIEAAHSRRRVQDAVAASGRASQAVPLRTVNRRPFFPTLALAFLRARDVFQRQQQVLGTSPRGTELPAS